MAHAWPNPACGLEWCRCMHDTCMQAFTHACLHACTRARTQAAGLHDGPSPPPTVGENGSGVGWAERDDDADSHLYRYIGYDNYHTSKLLGLEHVGIPAAVPRISTARWTRPAVSSQEPLMVTVAFSDQPYLQPMSTVGCDARYDDVCSIAYTRRLLGNVISDLILATTQAELQLVMAKMAWGQYNLAFDPPAATFYPYLYNAAGVCIAHGLHFDLAGQTLEEIIEVMAVTGSRKFNNHTVLLQSFLAAARSGGAWVPYPWRSADGTSPSTKIGYILGLQLLGEGCLHTYVHAYSAYSHVHTRAYILGGPHSLGGGHHIHTCTHTHAHAPPPHLHTLTC